MNVWDAIKERNSIRVFKPDPVPRQIIENLLRAGVEAPSSANMQPWEFVVVGGEDKDQLSRSLLDAFSNKGKDYDFQGKEIQFPERLLKRRRRFFDELFGKLKDKDIDPKPYLQESTLRFWGAPIVVMVFMDERMAKRFFLDVGICVQNIVLAAQAEGLGTHLIGLILKYQNTIKESLGVPLDKRLAVGICLGYPDWGHPLNQYKPQRDDLEQFVKWAGY